MELLAPAGNETALKTAVYHGADAVYIGLGEFNARRKAENFNLENIVKNVDFCHLYGVKVYLAMNTALKESETERAAEYVKTAYAAHIDAIIISDLSLVPIIRLHAPKMPYHASTQLGIHNADGAKVAERLGFSRIILSRETLIEDIEEIKAQTALEVEVFVHGALCVAFSGGCLFSGISSGNSGNRGRCLQLCRKKYTCEGEAFYLSPKDLCMINKLEQLKNAGVDSIKIEGRMRKPSYVGAAVNEYRRALDGKTPNIRNILVTFNRGGMTEGYNYDDNVMSPLIQGHMGVKIGKVIGAARDNITVSAQQDLSEGDGYKLIKNGAEIMGGGVYRVNKKGESYVIAGRFNESAAECDFYLTRDKNFEDKITSFTKLLAVKAEFYAAPNEKLRLNLTCNNHKIQFIGDYTAQKAVKRAVSETEIIALLSRTGGTEFFLSEVEAYADNVFIPISVINDLRRSALEELKRRMLADYNGTMHKTVTPCRVTPVRGINCEVNFIERETLENVNDVLQVLTPTDYAAAGKITNAENALLRLPVMMRGRDKDVINTLLDANNFLGIMADNIYAVNIALERSLPCLGGYGLNVYNRNHAKMLGLNDYIASAELRSDETDKNAIVFAGGYLPLMTLTHCPRKIKGGDCGKCKKEDTAYADGHGSYAVKTYRVHYCYHRLYNSLPHFIENTGGRRKYISEIKLAQKELGCGIINLNEFTAAGWRNGVK